MGESNGDWGYQEDRDPTRASAWDRLVLLGQYADNVALTSLMESKGLTKSDLTRIGTRVASVNGQPALAWLFPDGLKYRVIATGQRLSEPGVTWTQGKLVRHPDGPHTGVIVAEGETDGANLMKFGTHDVYILPNGARSTYQAAMVAPLEPYATVYVATDADEAGDAAAAALMDLLGARARRMRPPEGYVDWTEYGVAEPEVWREHPDDLSEGPRRVVYSIRELIEADLGTYEENHWFEAPIAPRQGQVAIHGPQKSLKSFVAMELLRAIATGDSFGGYVPFVAPEPGKVLLVQFEVPPLDFFYRAESFRLGMDADRCALFDERFFTYGIADRRLPRLKATDKNLLAEIRYAVDQCQAEVVAFDPVQRMTGAVNVNQMHELEGLLSVFDDLRNDGMTVLFTAHDKKERNRSVPSGETMVGTQRFGADPDVIGHVWQPPYAVPDDNTLRAKQRQINWTLRSGVAEGRLVTVQPLAANDRLVTITFGERTFGVDDDDSDAPDVC